MLFSENVLLFLLLICSTVFSTCPDGFDQVDSKCLSVSNFKAIHPKAKSHCQQIGGSLVSIHSAIDNHAILTYSSNTTYALWIGLNCKVNKSPKDCTWDDGTVVDYNNFLPGYPVTNIGSCVYMDPSNQPLKGRWISATCDLEEAYFICESAN